MTGKLADALSSTVTSWKEAFLFAHDEVMRSFDALSHGDCATARALLESAERANSVAAAINRGAAE